MMVSMKLHLLAPNARVHGSHALSQDTRLLRARALNTVINDSLRITQQEALEILNQVETEINQAIVGSIIPFINIFDFVNGDILV